MQRIDHVERPTSCILLDLQLALLVLAAGLVVGLALVARVLDDWDAVGVALNLLGLLGLVVLAVLEAVAAVLPVIALDRAATVAPRTRVAAVAVVAAASSSTSTAATTSAATTSATRPVVAAVAVLAPVRLGALPLGLDALLLALHLRVLLLAHHGEVVGVELGGGVEGEELLLAVLGVELDKDASLESAVCLAPLAHHDGAVGAEELLERNLAGLVVAEALDVGAPAEVVGGGALQAEEKVGGGGRVLLVVVPGGDGDGLLALDGLVAGAAEVAIVDDDEVVALAQGVHDGAVGLEATHALEVGNVLDADGAVLGAVELLEQVLVGDEVVGGEVELDLAGVSMDGGGESRQSRRTWLRISTGSSVSGRSSNSLLRALQGVSQRRHSSRRAQ